MGGILTFVGPLGTDWAPAAYSGLSVYCHPPKVTLTGARTLYPAAMVIGRGPLVGGNAVGVLDRLAREESLGIFVGAGVSIEAGLPSWNTLIKRLLESISIETNAFRKATDELGGSIDSLPSQFANRTIAALGPLGAGAIIKAHLGAAYQSKVKAALYLDVDVPAPGPTALSIARLVLSDEAEKRRPILTTNFDELLELALERELQAAGEDPNLVCSALPDASLDDGKINVVHLHGILAHPFSASKDSDAIVFSEDEFLAPEEAGERSRQLAESALRESPYLFLGASLTDTNVLGYLYRHQREGAEDGPRHVTVSVSQQAAGDLNPAAAQVVVEALQQTSAARLRNAQVEVAFVETYSEASQFVAELNLQRAALKAGESTVYAEAPWCWHQRAHRFEQRALATGLLPASSTRSQFGRLQKRLRKLLDESVTAIGACFTQVPAFRNDDEQLAVHLWVNAPLAGLLSMVGQSDGRLYNPVTMQAARATLPTHYLVVEALCNGTVVEARDQGLASSRWGSMIAVPFAVTDAAESRGPVPASIAAGVVVLASTSFAHSGLGRLHSRPHDRAQLLAALRALGSESCRTLIDHAPALDSSRPDLEHLEPRGFGRGRAGRSESDARRIGADTIIGGAPSEDVDLGAWAAVVPVDLESRLRT